MTDKTLNAYYKQHKDRYQSLAQCTSVPEVILKIDIFGKRWSHLDWIFLFTCIIENVFQNAMFPGEGTSSALFDDILDAIDNTELLDNVMTNKKIMLSIIHICNCQSIISYNVKTKLYILLAHAFKKFPNMWNLSWMYAKYKDSRLKKWVKYHRLHKSLCYVNGSKDSAYYNSRQFYDDFLKKYLVDSIYNSTK